LKGTRGTKGRIWHAPPELIAAKSKIFIKIARKVPTNKNISLAKGVRQKGGG